LANATAALLTSSAENACDVEKRDIPDRNTIKTFMLTRLIFSLAS
jgi:hypothetical protein